MLFKIGRKLIYAIQMIFGQRIHHFSQFGMRMPFFGQRIPEFHTYACQKNLGKILKWIRYPNGMDSVYLYAIQKKQPKIDQKYDKCRKMLKMAKFGQRIQTKLWIAYTNWYKIGYPFSNSIFQMDSVQATKFDKNSMTILNPNCIDILDSVYNFGKKFWIAYMIFRSKYFRNHEKHWILIKFWIAYTISI